MGLAQSCLNYVTGNPGDRFVRVRDQVHDFLREIADAKHVELWSSIFDEDDDLFTDSFHGEAEGEVQQPHSSVLTRQQVEARAIDGHVLEIASDVPVAVCVTSPATLLILFTSSATIEPDDLATLGSVLKTLVDAVVNRSIRHLHEAVVNASHQSKDLTSFLHRIIQSVLIPEFRFGGVSIFYHEQKTRSLILGATTGIERQEKLGLKRSDVRYFVDDKSFTARCWREGRDIVENVYQNRPLPRNTLGELATKLHSRVYAPLRRWVGRTSEEKVTPVGVIRAINANSDNNYHPLTTLEAARLRILSDAVSVLTERYVRAVSILQDQERATHGYNTDLAAIRYAAQNIERWLGRAEMDDTAPAQRELALQEIRYRIRDILAVQDNMASQIITVMHHSGSSRLVSKDSDAQACAHPFTDVIMRLMAAKKGMSECYGRRELRLTFGAFPKADDGFIRIPPLKISVGNVYLVFRNLAENAIKYSRKGLAPQLDIAWRQDKDFVEFLFTDQGIGIPESEHHLVLREGFRGREAQELQLRGNGLGLSVSRTAVEAAGGTLAFRAPPAGTSGACFVVRLPI